MRMHGVPLQWKRRDAIYAVIQNISHFAGDDAAYMSSFRFSVRYDRSSAFAACRVGNVLSARDSLESGHTTFHRNPPGICTIWRCMPPDICIRHDP